MRKKILLPLLVAACLISIYGCGYTMAGIGDEKPVIYYLENVNNNSNDLMIGQNVKKEVTRFFYDYGSLVDNTNDADYILSITLLTKNINFSSESSSRVATQSQLTLVYNFLVEDKQRRIVFNRNFEKSDTFNSENNITTYNRNLEKVFHQLTADIMSEFKYAFEVTSSPR